MARASNFSSVLDDVRVATHDVSDLTHVFVRARVSRAAQPFAGSLERLCALTPYAAELIVDDALRAGRGSRLELLVAAHDGDDALSRVRARFASLAGRGINVVVCTQRPLTPPA